MKRKQVMAAILATAVMTMTGLPAAFADSSPFDDVLPDSWYCEAVTVVNAHGMMVGIGDNDFGTSIPMSRTMVVQVLYNRMGKPEIFGDPAFSDVAESAWYYDAVQWAAMEGIVSGVGNGRFAPDENVTREQVAQLLYLAVGNPDDEIGSLDGFPDQTSVSGWAVTAMRWAVRQEIIHGVKNGSVVTLSPKGNATRAQAAQMLSRLVDLAGEHEYEWMELSADGDGGYACRICGKLQTD